MRVCVRKREGEREREYRVSYNLVFTLDSYLNPRGLNPRLVTSLEKGSLPITRSINPSIHPSPHPSPLTNPPNPISSHLLSLPTNIHHTPHRPNPIPKNFHGNIHSGRNISQTTFFRRISPIIPLLTTITSRNGILSIGKFFGERECAVLEDEVAVGVGLENVL